MIELIKMDIKNNKVLIGIILIFISGLTLSLYLGFYEIHFFNLNLENFYRLSNYNTNFLRWIEIVYPVLYALFIIKIISDTHSKESIEYTLSLPVSRFEGFIFRVIFWNFAFFLGFLPSILFFKNAIILGVGIKYLPHMGLGVYVFINMFVLSGYILLVQILTGGYHFGLATLFGYILMDYFSEGRLLGSFSLFPYSFKDYIYSEFVFIRARIFSIGILMFFLTYLYLRFYKTR